MVKHCIYPQILHTIVWTNRRVVAGAVKLRFENRPPAIEFELVLVEDVVEHHQLLSKSRCDVHGHCHGGDHKIALINQVNELPQGKMPKTR